VRGGGKRQESVSPVKTKTLISTVEAKCRSKVWSGELKAKDHHNKQRELLYPVFGGSSQREGGDTSLKPGIGKIRSHQSKNRPKKELV